MSTKEVGQRTLYYVKKPSRWRKGIGAVLPQEYIKFWREWHWKKPVPVHYIKKEGNYKFDIQSRKVHPVQNVPLPLLYPKELHEGIWGGEAIVQGFVQRGKYEKRTPRFWMPNLKQDILYSEVLDAYMRTVVTQRTMNLIHENCGFDHYLLKTPACDLKSLLALKLKRKILIALADKTLYPNDSKKREEVYAKYEQYLSAYTREEIEWYGLSYPEACRKYNSLDGVKRVPKPLKIEFRSNLLAKLKEAKIKEAENVGEAATPEESSSWLSKLKVKNPFSKEKTPKEK